MKLKNLLVLLFFYSLSSNVFAQSLLIHNGINGDGYYGVEVDNAGNSRVGVLDPDGSTSSKDVFYDYSHFVSVGNSSSALDLARSTITTRAFRTGTGQVSSAGSFRGENGIVRWTAVSSIIEGQDMYTTRFTFTSENSFGKVRFFQYFDEDVDGENDDNLVVIGTPNRSEFQLLTVDGTENVGVAQGSYISENINATFMGWNADEYPKLLRKLENEVNTLTHTHAGTVLNIPRKTDHRYPGFSVYGPRDITSLMTFELDPSAKFASIILYVGGSRDGKPIVITPSESLKSPVHTKYNTYLNQKNYLELISTGSLAIDVNVKLYTIAGKLLASTMVNIEARKQVDIDINAILVASCRQKLELCSSMVDDDRNGVPDTYGLIKLEFEDNNPNKRLLGRISNYKHDQQQSNSQFSFAFSRELTNPIRGASYSSSNTFDAQGAGNTVPNWTEVINLDPSASKKFTYNLFTENGSLAFTRNFLLPPLGELDMQAGHEILNAQRKTQEAIYLVEVIPEDPNAEYLMYVSRYSSKESGIHSNTFNYAFALEGRNGSNAPIFAPIVAKSEDQVCAIPNNWVEVINVRNIPVRNKIIFRDSTGKIHNEHSFTLSAKSQFHFNASALIPSGSNGIVEVSSEQPNALIAQSLVYYHDCEWNSLQTAYITPLMTRGTAKITGTTNTFIEMDNMLRMFSTVTNPVSISFDVHSLNGSVFQSQKILDQVKLLDLDLKNDPSILISNNSYGSLNINTVNAGDVQAQVLRVRKIFFAGKNRLDFIMPTYVR